MYRVLIVDDERLIREGLRGLIDWEARGFQVDAVASDGVEALELVASTPVDLVIVDIRMPRMGGLDFLQNLRARGHQTHCLVLSGFAEFEYAQRASALQIDGYLLKPVDEDELVRHLATIGRKLDGERFSALNLVGGETSLPPSFAWGRWQVLLLAPLSPSGQPVTLDPETDQRFRNLVREKKLGEVFYQPPHVGILMQQVYPRGHNLDVLAHDLGRALVAPSRLFAAAVGEVATDPSGVPDSAHQARELLGHRFFLTPNTIAWQPPICGTGAFDGAPWADRLALALGTGKPESLGSTLGQIASAVQNGATEDEVKESFSQIVAAAVEKRFGTQSTAWLADLWRQPFLSTLVDFLHARLSHLMARDQGTDAPDLAQVMVDLIETRYAENLKLDTLAEVLHYNSAYLGKLFRNKTGEYFNTYVDTVRIRHAQRLLREGHKVYQVAELVGYKYVDYFHAKFKKYTGVSPSQFKDLPE